MMGTSNKLGGSGRKRFLLISTQAEYSQILITRDDSGRGSSNLPRIFAHNLCFVSGRLVEAITKLKTNQRNRNNKSNTCMMMKIKSLNFALLVLLCCSDGISAMGDSPIDCIVPPGHNVNDTVTIGEGASARNFSGVISLQLMGRPPIPADDVLALEVAMADIYRNLTGTCNQAGVIREIQHVEILPDLDDHGDAGPMIWTARMSGICNGCKEGEGLFADPTPAEDLDVRKKTRRLGNTVTNKEVNEETYYSILNSLRGKVGGDVNDAKDPHSRHLQGSENATSLPFCDCPGPTIDLFETSLANRVLELAADGQLQNLDSIENMMDFPDAVIDFTSSYLFDFCISTLHDEANGHNLAADIWTSLEDLFETVYSELFGMGSCESSVTIIGGVDFSTTHTHPIHDGGGGIAQVETTVSGRCIGADCIIDHDIFSSCNANETEFQYAYQDAILQAGSLQGIVDCVSGMTKLAPSVPTTDAQETDGPTSLPTTSPTPGPTTNPSASPTPGPTTSPSASPTPAPTASPTMSNAACLPNGNGVDLSVVNSEKYCESCTDEQTLALNCVSDENDCDCILETIDLWRKTCKGNRKNLEQIYDERCVTPEPTNAPTTPAPSPAPTPQPLANPGCPADGTSYDGDLDNGKYCNEECSFEQISLAKGCSGYAQTAENCYCLYLLRTDPGLAECGVALDPALLDKGGQDLITYCCSIFPCDAI